MDHQAATSGDHSLFEKFTAEHPVVTKLSLYVPCEISEDDTLQPSNVAWGTPQKNTILHVAAKLKQVEKATNIIADYPSLLRQTNLKGDTPLHIAARIGCLEMAQLLIESAYKYQDVESDENLLRMVNVGKDTALHEAVRNGHFEIVKLLIEKDSDLASLENDAGESALFLAVDRKYFQIARHILQEAPSFSYRGRNGMNVMHAAIIRTTNAEDYFLNGYTARVTIISYVPHMIKTSFWKSKRTKKLGCTEIDFIEEVKKKCPSTILKADEFGWIPLHYAALIGHVEAVELFLRDNDSLAYKKDSNGMSTIHIAAREGHVGVMKNIIGKCPDASELLDNNGGTALHVAAESGKTDVVKYILNTPNFADLINEQDKEGNTPLMLAGVYGHHKVAMLLANDSRVDKGVVNQKGLAAIDIILANTEIDSLKKTRLARRLKWTGGLAIASMKGVINTENTKTNKQTYKKAEPQVWKAEQDPKKLKDITKFDIIAVTIIASVTFAAGFNRPGGCEDNALSKSFIFLFFVMSDAIAFFSSAFAIIIHFFLVPLDKNHPFSVRLLMTARFLTYASMVTMIAAFVAGTTIVLKSVRLAVLIFSPILVAYVPVLWFIDDILIFKDIAKFRLSLSL